MTYVIYTYTFICHLQRNVIIKTIFMKFTYDGLYLLMNINLKKLLVNFSLYLKDENLSHGIF